MNRTGLVLGLGLGSLAPFAAQAQESFVLDEIVASAGLLPVAVNRTGATVETVDGETVAQGEQSVAQTLDRLPGVSLTSNGGLGSTATLRLRGLGGSYIGVRVDGMDMTDPSSTQTTFNFGTLTKGLPGRIEVLKGAQSAVYGSDAIAGVVDITTWRPEGLGFSGRAEVEAGSDHTYSGTLSFGQASERGEVALTLSHVTSDGYSARSSDDEEDGYEQSVLTLSAAYDLTDSVRLGFSTLYSDGTADFDRSATDPTGEMDETRKGARAFAQISAGAVTHEISVAWTETERVDGSAPMFYTRDFTGERRVLEYLGTAEINSDVRLAFGADWTEEKAKLDDEDYDADNGAAFGEVQYAATDALDLSLSLRYDSYSDFDDQLSGRGAMAWRLQDDLILRAVLGTGYRAPSLYERFNSSFGNPDLDPETSRSAEIGLEKRYGTASFAKATLFYTEIDDLIDYDLSTYTYNQVEGTTRSRGIELSGRYGVTDRFAVFGNYTYTDADTPSGRMVRVPRHDLNLGVEAGFTDRLSGTLALQQVADAVDYTDAYPDTGDLDDYTVVNASVSFAVSDKAEAYVRLENLFDEDYETIRGYNTSDRAVFVGLRASF